MKRFSTGLLVGLLIGLILAGTTMAFANSPIRLIINGKEIVCDVAPQIINGRVMVPIRAVADNFNSQANWDSNTQTVTITSNATIGVPSSQTQSSEKQEAWAWINRVNAAIAEGSSLHNKKTISHSDASRVISNLKTISKELKAWGCLSEYDDLKSLQIKMMGQLGTSLMNLDLASDGSSTAFIFANMKAMDTEKYNNCHQATSTEIQKLKKMNLL